MKSKPHPVLVLCLFAVLSTVTGRIIFAQETDEKKSAFEVGDLINLGIPIDNYFRDIGEYGEIPTYFGLQAYIEDYYKEILEELNAFKDQSSIEVDVRYEEETRRVLLDVDFYMEKENQTSLAGLDLSKLSVYFDTTDIPVKFRVVSEVVYRLEIRDADGLNIENMEGMMNEKVLFTLEQFSMSFSAYGSVEEGDGEEDLHLFPEGFQPAVFNLSGIPLIADPGYMQYNTTINFILRSNTGAAEITGRQMETAEFQMTSEQDADMSASFLLSHDLAEGTASMEVVNDDLESSNMASHTIYGELGFGSLAIGDAIIIDDAELIFDGSADQFRVKGNLESDELMKIFPEKTAKKILKRSGETRSELTGSYFLIPGRFEGRTGDQEIQLKGDLVVVENQ